MILLSNADTVVFAFTILDAFTCIAAVLLLTEDSTFEIRVAFDVILALLDSMPLTAVELTLLIADAFELIPLINEELTVLILTLFSLATVLTFVRLELTVLTPSITLLS